MGKRVAIPKSVRFEVFKRDSFTCKYCGAKAPEVVLHVDHIKPVSKGGTNEILNLITACLACNLGKGAKSLSDQSTVERSRAQIEELQERREQLEMMMEWKNGLHDIEGDTVGQVSQYFTKCTTYYLNAPARDELRRHIRKYSVDEIVTAIDDVTGQYLRYPQQGERPTQESVDRAWNRIAAVCNVNRLAKDKPYLRDLYRLRGLLNSRLDYIDYQKCMQWMEAVIAWGASVEEIRTAVFRADDFSDFHKRMSHLVDVYRAKRDGNA